MAPGISGGATIVRERVEQESKNSAPAVIRLKVPARTSVLLIFFNPGVGGTLHMWALVAQPKRA